MSLHSSSSAVTNADYLNSSNATSSHFLGTAQRPWMISDPRRQSFAGLSRSTRNINQSQTNINCHADPSTTPLSAVAHGPLSSRSSTTQSKAAVGRSSISCQHLPVIASVQQGLLSAQASSNVSPASPPITPAGNDCEVTGKPQSLYDLDMTNLSAIREQPNPNIRRIGDSAIYNMSSGQIPGWQQTAQHAPQQPGGTSSFSPSSHDFFVTTSNHPQPSSNARVPISQEMPRPSSPRPIGPDNSQTRPPTQAPNPTNTNHLLQTFNDQVRKLAANYAFDNVTMVRVRMVRDACESGDFFLILLHQLYCLSAVQPQWMNSELGFTHQQHTGLLILGQLFDSNSTIRPEILNFFASFMTQPPLLRQHELIRRWIERAKAFLALFEQNMNTLIQFCNTGGCAPSARVMANCLPCIDSIVFQQLCFVAILHQLFPNRSVTFNDSAINLFLVNQAGVLKQFRHGTFDLSTDLNAEPDVQSYIGDFRNLCYQHHQTPQRMLNIRQQPLQPIHLITLLEIGKHIRSLATLFHPQSQTFPIRPDFVAQNVSYRPQQMVHHRHQASNNIGPQRVQSAHSGSINLRQQQPAGLSVHVTPMSASPVPLFPSSVQGIPLRADSNQDDTALHRSSERPSSPSTTDPASQVGNTHRIYTFTEGLLLFFPSMHATHGYRRWQAIVPDQVMSRKMVEPRFITGGYQENSLMFRLRCIALPISMPYKNVKEVEVWSTKPTHWPRCGFFSINGHFVEPREKAHHKQDLSIDVTALLREGANEIEVSYHSVPSERDMQFLIAIEYVNTTSFDTATQIPTFITAKQSLQSIVQCLKQKQKQKQKNCERVTTEPHLSIDLIDPFTSRPPAKPVRGQTCLHRECFDLDTYLRSRPTRIKNDFLVSNNIWLCPICMKDTRPTSLLIDGFLLNVIETLAKEGKKDVKAILVNEDGTWKPRVEPAETPMDTDTETQQVAKPSAQKSQFVPRVEEVTNIEEGAL